MDINAIFLTDLKPQATAVLLDGMLVWQCLDLDKDYRKTSRESLVAIKRWHNFFRVKTAAILRWSMMIQLPHNLFGEWPITGMAGRPGVRLMSTYSEQCGSSMWETPPTRWRALWDMATSDRGWWFDRVRLQWNCHNKMTLVNKIRRKCTVHSSLIFFGQVVFEDRQEGGQYWTASCCC